MNKYIDAKALKAEIERLQKFNNSMSNIAINSNMRNFYDGEEDCCKQLLSFIDSQQQEQSEIDLEKFTQKMDDWKARYVHPDSIPIKATMAFTARMFYMYPDIAREWYDGLPKITQD